MIKIGLSNKYYNEKPNDDQFCSYFLKIMLSGKKILISGLLSNRSIAYGIAQSCSNLGAELAFTYQDERFTERINDLSKNLQGKFAVKCNVELEDDITGLPEKLKNNGWSHVDGYVHAIAHAPREAISGDFTDGLTKENFTSAHVISSYSFGAVTKALEDILSEDSSIITVSYIGSTRFVPNYNVMGLAKASLEASVRYLAHDLGPKKFIRVNAISAGPIKTLAASGIKGFSNILNSVEQKAALRRNITKEEIGNLAVFLLSDMSRSITSQVIVADNGYSNALLP